MVDFETGRGTSVSTLVASQRCRQVHQSQNVACN
jgi:hypothetical protein